MLVYQRVIEESPRFFEATNSWVFFSPRNQGSKGHIIDGRIAQQSLCDAVDIAQDIVLRYSNPKKRCRKVRFSSVEKMVNRIFLYLYFFGVL